MSAKEAEVTAAQLAQRDAELASNTRALLKLDEMRCAVGAGACVDRPAAL